MIKLEKIQNVASTFAVAKKLYVAYGKKREGESNETVVKKKPQSLVNLCIGVLGRPLEDIIEDLEEIAIGLPGDIKLAVAAIARRRKLLSDDLKDVEKATSNFTTIIGLGAFGSVYKAQMPTGETVAVKVLGANSRQGEQEFLTEVLLLGRLHHKNLVALVGYAAERGRHMLLYIYMSNGSLASHLYGKGYEPLSWDLRLSIALDVARVLEYLHYGADPPIVHRDIKPSNILLDEFMKAKVTDFGLSRPEMIKPRASNIRGTFGYLDPEYISTSTFTKKSDVYSFGVLLFELITGRNPQQGLIEYVKLAAMESEGKIGWEEIVDPQLNENYDVNKLNDMASLAFKCVSGVSKTRPSMRTVVQALSKLYKKPKRNHSQTSSTARPIIIGVCRCS
ncbi:calcium/calmodulin-regulated receptor-like kinase 1 [Lathyrus oleraceus]|uniref:calcium/calmodulin-regulated receptor-like kinase 1 n=1 Tax=Pisum sativum TaxID=3888 RepID=UPI0021D38D45|nr:calcium/calmodulin-regulated receptor-like kinase 1 [Pisum sativum]